MKLYTYKYDNGNGYDKKIDGNIKEGLTDSEKDQMITDIQNYYDAQNNNIKDQTTELNGNIVNYNDDLLKMYEIIGDADEYKMSSDDLQNFGIGYGQEISDLKIANDDTVVVDIEKYLSNKQTSLNKSIHVLVIKSEAKVDGKYDRIYINDDYNIVIEKIQVTESNGDAISHEIEFNLYTQDQFRKYGYKGSDHPIKDDRYDLNKALNDDTKLLVQQNQQIGILGGITVAILLVGAYVLGEK
jgi:hypothetical protein